MACYLPDHLVRCLICKNLFSDARRLRCSCVYCYTCCLKLIDNLTIYCHCSATHRFHTKDELEKALVIDTVVNDLVRQHIKQKQSKSIDDESTSISSRKTQLAVVQPPCSICKMKNNLVILCQHCQNDICEICINKHYEIVTNLLETQWKECREKLDNINQHVFLSHLNKTKAQQKLTAIKRTIDERAKDLKTMINERRRTLIANIDDYVENLEQTVRANNVDEKYRLIKERLPQILEGETNSSDLVSFLDEIEQIYQDLNQRDKQVKQMEFKIMNLSQPNSLSLDLGQLIGELQFDDQLSSSLANKLRINTDYQAKSNQTTVLPLMPVVSERLQATRRTRGTRGGRSVQYSSHLTGPSSRYSNHYRGRRGRVSSRPHLPPPPSSQPIQSHGKQFDVVPNNQYQWSLDFKEIPFFLSVLDNRNRARQSNATSHSKHDYLLFVTDDYGQMNVYNLPKSMSYTKPTRVGSSELFSKNSRLLMESFAVYEFAIIVYVRRFEQRTNEIEHSKLIKAGLPIMKGEQGRCNDHGGMIYLFSHNGQEIDGVYQSHPIRIILADSIFGRLWAMNPMENHLYSCMIPNTKSEIRKCLQEEEIVFDFSDEQFEPNMMFQSNQSIGFIDSERDIYRLYKKDDRFRLITTYENAQETNWKLIDGLIFKDNRSLLRLIEDKSSNDRFEKTSSRRCLIELTDNGEKKRRIHANTLYSMTLGPNDELILGFAVRGDRGLVHCY